MDIHFGAAVNAQVRSHTAVAKTFEALAGAGVNVVIIGPLHSTNNNVSIAVEGEFGTDTYDGSNSETIAAHLEDVVQALGTVDGVNPCFRYCNGKNIRIIIFNTKIIKRAVRPFFCGCAVLFYPKHINNFNPRTERVSGINEKIGELKCPSLTNNASADSKANGLGATTHIPSLITCPLLISMLFRLEANAEGSTVVAVEASNQALCKMVTLLQYKEQVHPCQAGCTLVGTLPNKKVTNNSA